MNHTIVVMNKALMEVICAVWFFYRTTWPAIAWGWELPSSKARHINDLEPTDDGAQQRFVLFRFVLKHTPKNGRNARKREMLMQAFASRAEAYHGNVQRMHIWSLLGILMCCARWYCSWRPARGRRKKTTCWRKLWSIWASSPDGTPRGTTAVMVKWLSAANLRK